MKRFDAIIIGTGQAGPSLAARFAAVGKTVAIQNGDWQSDPCCRRLLRRLPHN
jgi:pyruvate/2-oxoglutarate dehydrogenase complex dihydrolipoamide dehydrogenase (E3) component